MYYHISISRFGFLPFLFLSSRTKKLSPQNKLKWNFFSSSNDVSSRGLSLKNYDIMPLYQIRMNYTANSVALLLRHWYEIRALYYVKSILTEISASRQDRKVLQKSKIIRIKFLSIWGMLQTSRCV